MEIHPVQTLLDILYPRSCPLCGKTLPPGNILTEALCPDCQKNLIPLEDPLCLRCGAPLISENRLCLNCREEDESKRGWKRALSLYPYRDAPRELIYQYKFRGKRYLAPFLANRLIDRWGRRFFKKPLVPVPSEPRNRKRRGWDPVLHLTRELARQSGGTVHSVLCRKRSLSQKGLDREGRKENLLGKIVLKRRPPEGEVLLIDDIWTTGATAEVSSQNLSGGGRTVVFVVTLARV